jgi:hypothetical protein
LEAWVDGEVGGIRDVVRGGEPLCLCSRAIEVNQDFAFLVRGGVNDPEGSAEDQIVQQLGSRRRDVEVVDVGDVGRRGFIIRTASLPENPRLINDESSYKIVS